MSKAAPGSHGRRTPGLRLSSGWRDRTVACAAFLMVPLLTDLASQPARSQEVDLVPVASGLADPVAITHAGDSRLFLTLQAGQVVIFDGDEVRPQPFLDIRSLVSSGGERGLLSVAFHPDSAQNRFFFVNYTNNAGDTVIARYRVSNNPDLADPQSGVTLMTLGQPFANHNGGQLQFGPDGFLYIAMGDGGSAFDPACNAQRNDTLLGKMLRIDVDQNMAQAPFYGIPPDNPFVGGGGLPAEVWATGLRNPWRFSFDAATGDVLIADVGQGQREEINYQPAESSGGENYGWKLMEGTRCTGTSAGCPAGVPPCNAAAYTLPVLEYNHNAGDCAVVGGHVYRGSQIADLNGVYLYGDFCTGRLLAGTRNGNQWTAQPLSRLDLGGPHFVPGLTSFGEDVEGEIYLTAQDTLYRVVGPAGQPGALEFSSAGFTADEREGSATVTVRRTGGSDGEVTVDYATQDGSAVEGQDYVAAAGTLSWSHGDASVKTFQVDLVDDLVVEDEETVNLVLSQPTGGAVLGTRSTAELVLNDDDVAPPVGPCVPGPTTLCLNDRFRVEVSWRDTDLAQGPGQAQVLSQDSGYFWFFSPDNLEVLVKVIDACFDPFQRFWVFAAGLTNVETTLTVVDTEANQVRQYKNPQGQPFLPIQDTQSFAACP